MYWKNIHLNNDEPLQFDCHIYQEFSNSEASSIEHKQWYINIKKYDGKVKPHMKNKVFIFEAKTFDIDVDKEKIKRTLLVKKILHMEDYNPQDEFIELQHKFTFVVQQFLKTEYYDILQGSKATIYNCQMIRIFNVEDIPEEEYDPALEVCG